MAAGFEADPERLDGMAARFEQAYQEMADLDPLVYAAQSVDLQETPAGPAYDQAAQALIRACDGLARWAGGLGGNLNQSATRYRDANSSAAAQLDRLSSKLNP